MLEKIKKIRPYYILRDIMKCFISACSISFLILFFNIENITYTQPILKEITISIFSFLITFTCTIKILMKDENWFYNKKNI